MAWDEKNRFLSKNQQPPKLMRARGLKNIADGAQLGLEVAPRPQVVLVERTLGLGERGRVVTHEGDRSLVVGLDFRLAGAAVATTRGGALLLRSLGELEGLPVELRRVDRVAPLGEITRLDEREVLVRLGRILGRHDVEVAVPAEREGDDELSIAVQSDDRPTSSFGRLRSVLVFHDRSILDLETHDYELLPIPRRLVVAVQCLGHPAVEDLFPKATRVCECCRLHFVFNLSTLYIERGVWQGAKYSAPRQTRVFLPHPLEMTLLPVAGNEGDLEPASRSLEHVEGERAVLPNEHRHGGGLFKRQTVLANEVETVFNDLSLVGKLSLNNLKRDGAATHGRPLCCGGETTNSCKAN